VNERTLTRRSGPLIAGGVLLIVLGSLLAVIMLFGIIVSLGEDQTEDAVTAGVFVLIGATQVWSGILSVRHRRTGKVVGIVLAAIGIALSLIYLLGSFTAEKFTIDPNTFEITSESRVNAGGVAISIIGFLGYVTALVLLSVGRPRPRVELGGTVRVLDRQGEFVGEGVILDRTVAGELIVEVKQGLIGKGSAVEDAQGNILTARFKTPGA
jgi:hypothetical protein